MVKKQPVNSGTSAQELFAIANANGGVVRGDRHTDTTSFKQVEPPRDRDATVISDDEGKELFRVHRDSEEEKIEATIKYMLLEKLPPNATDEDKAANKAEAERLFKGLQLLSLGRNVPLRETVEQGIKHSLSMGTFQTLDGKNPRTDDDDVITSQINEPFGIFLTRDTFQRLSDRAAASGKSNRSGFIAGVRQGLEAQTL